MSETCPLCGSKHHTDFAEKLVYVNQHLEKTKQRRRYRKCDVCSLIFVDKRHLPTYAEEKALYDQHDNDPNDVGYRKFLSRMANPILDTIAADSKGLDFGCGPGPTLYHLFEEAGHRCCNYDPLYADDKALLKQQYDFVCSTEVIEHIHWPRKSLDLIWQLIKPGGVLGLMTKRPTGYDAFMQWHYTNDPTHVRFFSEATFQWLAEQWQAKVSFPEKDVAVLTKR